MRTIRYANRSDSEILGRIHSESLQAGYKGIIPDSILEDSFSVENRTRRFISELTEGSPKTALIFEDNEPAGLISFGRSREDCDEPSCIEIWRVYLRPKFWGSGAAKELMEWGISQIRGEGFEIIELWALEENLRARRFYEKMGFKHDGTVKLINFGKEIRELRYTSEV